MDGFVRGIDVLSTRSLREIVGSEYDGFMGDIERIRIYRNKLMHGQITGQKISSRQLEKDIRRLEAWITAVARGCNAAFGYDGLARNTFRKARAADTRLVTSYPFSTVSTFGKWLSTLRRA
jgi:hypothetical protein